MNYKSVKNYVKKGAKNIRGKAIKRYFDKGYAPKVGQMAKDVMYLKKMINAEKKRISVAGTTTQVIGQLNVNNSGHYIADLSPVLAQGSGYDDRTGNSVKWTSSFLQFQFNSQSAMTRGIKLKFYFIAVEGLALANVSTAMGQFINANVFTSGTIYDLNSQRNPDYFKNFRVLRTYTCSLQPDDYTGQSQVKNVNIGLRLERHLKWSLDSATLTEGQVLLLIVADNGNCNQTTPSTTTNAYETAANTGVFMNYNYTHYFMDN